MPFILVGAGPSLMNQLIFSKDKTGAIIVTSNSLSKINQFGIRPPSVTADPLSPTARGFQG